MSAASTPGSDRERRTTISVVVPAYNAAATIGQTLASLAGQLRQPDEVIVVDDASTDDTVEVARRYGDLLPLRVIGNESNSGVGLTRRRGLAEATMETFTFVDSDDVLFPHHLHELERIYTGPGCIAAPQFFSWTPGVPLDAVPSSAFTVVPPPEEQPAAILEGAFVWIACLFSREDYEATEGFQDFATGEDWDVWIQLIHGGARVVQCHVPSVLYRQRPGSLTTNVDAMLAREIEILERHLPRLDAELTRRAKATIRRRRARLQMMRAIRTAGEGSPMKGRLMHAQAALTDRSLRRLRSSFNHSVTGRALVGVVQPARGYEGLVAEPAPADTGRAQTPGSGADRPTVTVIVPAYKAEDIIGPTLAGLMTLNPRPDGSCPIDEVIVVDDASPDETAKIAAQFANHLPLRILSLEQNGGVGIARTTATKEVTTDLTLYADADDIVLPDHLDLLLAEYRPGAMVSARALNWVVVGNDTEAVSVATEQPLPDSDHQNEILRHNFVFIGTLVETDHFRRVGSFGELRKGEDWDAWIRMIRSGVEALTTAGPSVLYRVHASSSSHSSPYGLLDADIALLESMLPDADPESRVLITKSLRRRRAVHDIVTARLQAADGKPMAARRTFFRALRTDPTFADFGPNLKAPALRALAGIIDPYRLGRSPRPQSADEQP